MHKLMISEAAKELGCHPETVRRLERRGILKAKRNWLAYQASREGLIVCILITSAEIPFSANHSPASTPIPGSSCGFACYRN